MDGASDEFLEVVAICRGDSVDESNNATHLEAFERAKQFLNLTRKKNTMSLKIVKGVISGPQKVVIYGEPGVGKTTLASQFPNPLIIDAEKSSAHTDVDRVFVESWEDTCNVLKEVKGLSYDTVIVDTVDWVEMQCVKALCEAHNKKNIEDFGYGKGYMYLKEKFLPFLELCDGVVKSGKNLVLLAHNYIRKIELPDETGAFDRHELKLSKHIAPLVMEWADALLFMSRVTFVEKSETGKAKARGGKERKLYTNDNSICLAKARWPGLGDVIDADVSAFEKYLFKNDSAKQVQSAGDESPKEQGDLSAEKGSTIPEEKSALQRLETAVELSPFSQADLLAYLYGANSKKRQFLAPGTEFKDIPESLIEKMLGDAAWDKISTSIINNKKA